MKQRKNYKVGDRVRVTKCSAQNPSHEGRIGKVLEGYTGQHKNTTPVYIRGGEVCEASELSPLPKVKKEPVLVMNKSKEKKKKEIKPWLGVTQTLNLMGKANPSPTRRKGKECPKKYCISCKKTRSTKTYSKDISRKDGLNPYCKHCRASYGREYRQRAYAKMDKNKSKAVWYWGIRDKIFDKYGNKCNRCGYADKRALQIDHINGGGRKEIMSLFQMAYLKKVLADTTGSYQILCANCNWIKRSENKEYSKGKYGQK